MAPTSSDSSCRIIGTRKREKATSKANTNAFALLSMACLNNATADTRRGIINTWIQSSTGAISPQVPFSDNNTRIEWDEPLEDDVDVRIVEEVRPVRLGDQQQQPPLQERNRQENASRVVATSPALEIIRPQAPGPLDLRRTKTHLAPKWAAASLRGKLLIEQVQNLQRAPATSPVDFRPPATASTAQTPQLAPGALFTNDPRNVPRPSHPVPIDASMGDELQNERSTFLESPYPNSLGNPSFDDVHSPLGDSRIEKGLTSIIEVNKEIERFFAPGNRPGGGQQVAAHQGVEGNRNPVFGGSANMIPINGGGYPHTQNGSEREAPKAQGTPYMHNAPARAPPRAPTSQYKSPYTKDAMSPYTKNSTDSYPNNSAVRGPQIAGANVNTQSMPTREPPRKEGEFSRVHTALLLDASKAGKVMPEERLSKNLSSVPTNPSFLRNSSTSESASPFAGVIHSPGPSKTPSNTKYHNSSTYPDPEPNSTDEAPAKSRIGDHRTSSFRVEINSSPMPLLHGPPSRFQSGKKRGRPFANPEAAAKAVEKAARQQLSETGENTGKKRGRPFATAEAAEKAAKKMKSTSDESEEPKKRGRPFATEKKIEAPDPCFPVFYCEWKGCPAELHNLETLRKHLHILHGKRDKVTGMIPCMFRKCANSHTETKAAGEGIEASSDIAKENFGEKKAAGEETETSPDIAKEDSGHELLYPIAFKKRSDWHAHLEEEHLIPIAWHLGDGPKFTEYSGPPGEYNIRKSEPWLFDANGTQVTPSVRNQKLEAGRASFNNGRRYKQQLLRELAQAKRESLLTAGNKVMKPSNSEKKRTGVAVVLTSRKISAEDYKKVDVDDDEDELAIDSHLGYEDVFDEEDEEEEVEGNGGDEMMV